MGTPGSQIQVTTVAPGDPNCLEGGQRIDVGVDTNGDGSLTGSGEIQKTVYVCNASSTGAFRIGGTLSGLSSSGTVKLQESFPGNSLTDTLTLNANGNFSFPTTVPGGTAYAVTLVSPAAGELCSLVNGTGTVGNSDVTNIVVNCDVPTVTNGGTISGIGIGEGVVLEDNGGDPISLSANGSFSFPTLLVRNQAYLVTVQQPSWGTCVVLNGAGPVGSSDVTNIQVTCTEQQFTVSGTLVNNCPQTHGCENQCQPTHGFFDPPSFSGLPGVKVFQQPQSFVSAPLSPGSSYAISAVYVYTSDCPQVGFTQLDGQVFCGETNISVACEVSNGTGAIGNADVTNVQVVCCP